eukprot:5195851-Pyramimonas_sp.AAC.1
MIKRTPESLRKTRGRREVQRGRGSNSMTWPPQGRRGLPQVCAVPHSAGPNSSPRKWRQFRRSQPPRDGE